jgi:hypothetical protein
MRSEKIVEHKSYVVYNLIKINYFIIKQPRLIDRLADISKTIADPKRCFVFFALSFILFCKAILIFLFIY